MGKTDMDHMQHLESVALSDCAVLQTKEATYQGSWKRAGGRSAWFMGRRNFDRLITMMQAKDFPDHIKTPQNVKDTIAALDHVVHYQGNGGWHLPGSIEATRQILAMLGNAYFADDIFAMIALNPKGEDGTVLACVRDARRYLMLIEAEMIAEGVVEPESKTYEQETGMYRPPETDVYGLIAEDTGISRTEVKDMIHNLFYPIRMVGDEPTLSVPANSEEPREEALVEALNGPEHVTMKDAMFAKPNGGGGYAAEQAARHPPKELNPEFQAVISEGMVHEKNRPMRPATAEDYARAEADTFGGPRPTPSSGSHHSSLTPWQVDLAYYNRLVERVGMTVMEQFYSRRTPNVFRLEPIVVSRSCPRELSGCYNIDRETSTVWVLRVQDLPDELKDQYPKLQAEMNSKEFEQSKHEFKFMYRLIGDKWTIMEWYREDWAA